MHRSVARRAGRGYNMISGRGGGSNQTTADAPAA
jgi:hypothetical protein